MSSLSRPILIDVPSILPSPSLVTLLLLLLLCLFPPSSRQSSCHSAVSSLETSCACPMRNTNVQWSLLFKGSPALVVALHEVLRLTPCLCYENPTAIMSLNQWYKGSVWTAHTVVVLVISPILATVVEVLLADSWFNTNMVLSRRRGQEQQ